jgi:hypothetical protein
MKEGGDHHVFGDGEPGVASLTHNEGGNPEKMCHVRNVGTLAPFDVDDTRVFDCARKPAGQVELLGFIVVRTPILCFHSASMCVGSRTFVHGRDYLPHAFHITDCSRYCMEYPASAWPSPPP